MTASPRKSSHQREVFATFPHICILLMFPPLMKPRVAHAPRTLLWTLILKSMPASTTPPLQDAFAFDSADTGSIPENIRECANKFLDLGNKRGISFPLDKYLSLSGGSLGYGNLPTLYIPGLGLDFLFAMGTV